MTSGNTTARQGRQPVALDDDRHQALTAYITALTTALIK